MKKTVMFLFATVVFSFIMIGCGEKKTEAVTVKDYETYIDPSTKYEIKIPKGWIQSPDPQFNRIIAVSTKKAKDQELFNPRIVPIRDENDPAAKIEVWAKELNDSMKFDKYFNMKTYIADVYSAPQPCTVGNGKGLVQSYKFPVGSEGTLEGEVYYAINKDSTVVFIIEFEALANSYQHYKPYFDEIVKSVKLPTASPKKQEKADTAQTLLPAPSPKTMSVSGDGFSIQIPDNFKKKDLGSKGKNVLTTYNYMGERRGDCNIQVDVMDGSKIPDLEKYIKEVRKAISSASEPQKITLGGQNGYVFAYQVRANSKSQQYFAKKGEKVYRVTINWFTGKNKDGEDEEKYYKEIFIKCAKSLKIN